MRPVFCIHISARLLGSDEVCSCGGPPPIPRHRGTVAREGGTVLNSLVLVFINLIDNCPP